MITHDEVRNALKEDNMFIVVDYINEQEKKDELLELYIKLSEINIQFSIYGCNVEDLKYQQYECLKQIKILEEELK